MGESETAYTFWDIWRSVIWRGIVAGTIGGGLLGLVAFLPNAIYLAVFAVPIGMVLGLQRISGGSRYNEENDNF